METKFTPGKWEVDKLAACNIYIPIKTDNPERGWILEAKGNHVNPGLTDEEMMANAKLIAAAPEMYQALINWLVEDTSLTPETMDSICIALKKASTPSAWKEIEKETEL